MAVSGSQRLRLATFLVLAILPLIIAAAEDGSTGSNRIETGQCPPNTEGTMVYSPFKPYFHWPKFRGDVQKCWVAADCLMEAAGESRKQQFASTALVMGLIPLTLKDIAWPERRIMHVTKELKPSIEILVLALGLVPVETGNKALTRRQSAQTNMIAKAAFRAGRGSTIFWVVVCSLLVVASYAGMAIMEIYSKRSSLGCPFPVFVPLWYVIALLPAAIHAFFARLRRRRTKKHVRHGHNSEPQQEAAKGGFDISERDPIELERKAKIVSAVQGADEEWPVQLAWGIYYIAGTLIFTSIMAVTVVELVCWVGLGFAVAGSSKILAFFLCLVFEDTGGERERE
ncbi:hypothetical protein BU24DRAFT_422107 [Aaosphaeria arxii CBS 175.79]|uniref:Uncharacterized protein n=1 Tax=Aaosphaeria arxii CBS 175.79 TaxID=1450172 RepID=A0A6A5XU71_9PLEO|nr:uncharacterized protein BU24DRAFT_422107 [Aaosphaeria arxii CBS 175.79]KAF2015794.1 hypothetical protein BU24DRAFT_422107 [Aaosphaeria arxii CBS 175.79]